MAWSFSRSSLGRACSRAIPSALTSGHLSFQRRSPLVEAKTGSLASDASQASLRKRSSAALASSPFGVFRAESDVAEALVPGVAGGEAGVDGEEAWGAPPHAERRRANGSARRSMGDAYHRPPE